MGKLLKFNQSTLILIIVLTTIFLWITGNITLKYVKQKVKKEYTAQLIQDGSFHYNECYYKVDLKLKKLYIDVNAPYYKEVEELNKNIK